VPNPDGDPALISALYSEVTGGPRFSGTRPIGARRAITLAGL